MTAALKILRNSFFLRPPLSKVMSECVASLSEGTINPLKRISDDVSPEIDELKKQRLDFQRVKRRKYAVLICYSGQGYLGLQRNPGMKTIEEDLLLALLKAGVINEEVYNQPKLLEFQRAARTDKGVSAVRQVLSIKLPLEICLKTINDNLPNQIRMVATKRATKGFNCKSNCDARTYSYMMPTFALAPQDEPLSETYRIPASIIENTNKVLQRFIGTHNYHNFTSRKKPLDPSAKRYMISFTCGDPFVVDGMEFVTLKVKGQSFMLHQIRKMVGLTIAVIRGLTSEETITKSYGEERYDIPIAPGVGLVLEEVHYDRYNHRFGKDGIHDPIEWSNVEEELEKFRKEYILPTIIKAEKEEKSMLTWLESLPLHSFGIRHGDRHEEIPPEESSEDVRDDPEILSNGKNSNPEADESKDKEIT